MTTSEDVKRLGGVNLSATIRLDYRDGKWTHTRLGEITEHQAREMIEHYLAPARPVNTGSAADYSGGYPDLGLVFDD